MEKQQKRNSISSFLPESQQQSSHFDTSNEEFKKKTKMTVRIDPLDRDLIAFAKCIQCSQRFSNTTRVPVTMACGHSVCKACLPRYTRVGHLYKCSKCMKMHVFGAHSGMKNITLYKLLEMTHLLDKRKPTRKQPFYQNPTAQILHTAMIECESIWNYFDIVKNFVKPADEPRYPFNPPISFFKRLRQLKTAMNNVEIFLSYVKEKLEDYKAEKITTAITRMKIDDSTDTTLDLMMLNNSELTDTAVCSVCFDGFNRTSRVPVSFPCGHTFCRRCVYYVIDGPRFKCCYCRHDHYVGLSHPNMDINVFGLLDKLNLLLDDEPTCKIQPPYFYRMESETINVILNAAISNTTRCATMLLSLIQRLPEGTNFPGFNKMYDSLTWLKSAFIPNKYTDSLEFVGTRDANNQRYRRRSTDSL